MGLDWKQWSRSDILYGVVAPVLVVLLIVGISQLGRLIGGGFEGVGGVVFGITMELEELLVIAAVPLTLGLVWNQWAGGASGFLMGSIYALYWSDSYHSPMAGNFTGAGTVLLAYILSAMLIGYMAGALNKRSENFRRMLIAGKPYYEESQQKVKELQCQVDAFTELADALKDFELSQVYFINYLFLMN